MTKNEIRTESAGMGRRHVLRDGVIIGTIQRVATDVPLGDGRRWNLSGAVVMDSPTSTDVRNRPIYRSQGAALQAILGEDAPLAKEKIYR